MFTLKATVLLAAPLLAAASEVIPSRIQRRAALLELLEHQNEKRAESYGTPDICSPDAGNNDATFNSLPAGGAFAEAVYAFQYANTDASCVTKSNCQEACKADADTCVGYVYAEGNAPTCTLYGGASYGGDAISTIPSNFELLQNAGSTEASAPTCASFTSGREALDTVSTTSGRCTCAPGRRNVNAFTCESDTVSPGAFKAPKTLTKPVTFVSPITWDYPIVAVPAVLTSTQCAAICQADPSCQVYLLRPGADLSKCWKIGASGAYDSPDPTDINFTPLIAARMAKRAVGQSGSVGAAGDVLGETTDSTLVNDAQDPTPSAGARMRMRVKRAHGHVQW